MRAVLLLVSLFGVVVLAVVAWQLLTLEWTPQGINQRPRDSRFWRSEQAPRHGRQSGSTLDVMRIMPVPDLEAETIDHAARSSSRRSR